MAVRGEERQEVLPAGFRDHDAVVRSKAFASAKLANDWVQEYIAAERRGVHSLRRFLLDLDARDASGDATGKTIGDVIQLYFAFNAPETADGLSASTFRTYGHSANRHLLGKPGVDKGKPQPPAIYAVSFAARPATEFNGPDAPRALREEMKHANVGPSARAHAWRVLSAVRRCAQAIGQQPHRHAQCIREQKQSTQARRHATALKLRDLIATHIAAHREHLLGKISRFASRSRFSPNASKTRSCSRLSAPYATCRVCRTPTSLVWDSRTVSQSPT